MKWLRQDRPQGGRQAGRALRVIMVPLLLVAALLAVAVAGYWLKRPAEAVAVDCADPVSGCTFAHRGQTARLRFSARPVPLQAFELRLEAPGAARARASAEFQMAGMDMGFNRYDLRPAGDALAARVTLPVCVSGSRDWTLYLALDGERYAIPFSTQ